MSDIKKKFYITTTLPYVNAEPHIGFAMEIIRADVIARAKRAQGYDVFFNTGTDEHGQKLYEGAMKENLTPQEYVDKNAEEFLKLIKAFNITNDGFIRTTDEKHIKTAEKFWNICNENGYIYKKNYQVKYCVGCELEKQDSELVDDKCPLHSNRELELIDEENYFFAWSKFEEKLKNLYKENNTFVTPDFRFNEIKSFVYSGLQDFSISRLKSKMSWGVPVPGDDNHVMYVWFDALTSYISTLDFDGYVDEKENNFAKYWLQDDNIKREVVQYCGKDNLRQQSAMWQGMLMAANIPSSTKIVINGFIISGGVKMSKSLGNVISPFEIIEKYKNHTNYAEEVLRFVLCHEVSSHEDSDVTMDSIQNAYTAYLQNGVGNQVNRVLKLSSTYLSAVDIEDILLKAEQEKMNAKYLEYLNDFKINEAVKMVTEKVKTLDEYIQKTEPFKLIKIEEKKEEAKEILRNCVLDLLSIGYHLYFFMPRTSMDMYNHIKENKMPEKPLFNRIIEVIENQK